MTTSNSVRPYEVRIPEPSLQDLRRRLGATRLPDAVAGAGWDYGTDLDYLEKLLAYWRDDFDWRGQERAINFFDHYRADIQGLGVHFLHQRGNGPNPTPLLMLHGWPSSFLQMLKIIPLLCVPQADGGDPADAFHVVVPSLPGYGFSDRPTEPGMSVGRIAEMLCELMTELGYERYMVRASDIGAGVAVQMALRAPEAVVALHMTGSSPFINLDNLPKDLTQAEQQMVADIQRFRREEFAYAMQHATRPQSLAVGLNDSPAGLAAWIVEKYRAWSDCHGDLETRFTRDELLTQLTVYWVTQTIGSSIRLYYENMHAPPARGQMRTPVAMAMLAGDVYHTPREWLERQGPLARYTELPCGGHFGEHEEPELLAHDLRAFNRMLR